MAATRKPEPAKVEPNIVQIAEHLSDAAPVEKPPLSEIVAEAQGLPNIDGKQSVLANLPKELYVEGRVEFAEEEDTPVPGARFGQPRTTEYVRCDPSWAVVIYCIKNDKRNGALHPVTTTLRSKHPELEAAAKRYIVRLAVIDDSDETLFWAVPHPSDGSTPTDRVKRQAQNAALTQWTKTWWDGYARHYAHPKDPTKFSEPVFPSEDYDTLFQRAIADDLIYREDHPYAQKLLR